MEFFSRTKLQTYLDEIVKNNSNEIIKVCTLMASSSSTKLPIVHTIDEPLYIVFKNNYALIIEYYNVCEITVEYRELTSDEKNKIANINCKDFFNFVDDVYNYNTMNLSKRISVNMNYSSVDYIEVKYFEGEYETWENNGIVTKDGTLENFDEIVIHLKNNNMINLLPQHADSDGYLDVWASVDYENVKEF